MKQLLAAASPAFLALALTASGCSGPAAIPSTPGTAPGVAAAAAKSPVQFAVSVQLPAKGAPASLKAAAYDAAHRRLIASATLDAGSGLPGCTTASKGAFRCTLALAAAPATISLDLQSYAAPHAGGAATPLLLRFVTPVSSGAVVGVTTVGTPAGIAIVRTSDAVFSAGSAQAGFHFGGVGPKAAVTLQVSALDADGNVLAGARAPQLSLASDDAAHLAVAAVPGTLHRTYVATPLAQSAAPVNLKATATPPGGAPLTASAPASLDPIAFVIDCWNTTVSAYAPWSAAPVWTLTSANGIAANSAMAIDASGNVYLANYLAPSSGTVAVMEFAPGKMTASRTISNVNYPSFLALDAAGDIFVVEQNADVEEFAPSGGGTPSRVLSASTSPSGIDSPSGLAVDGAGNLYVANAGGSIGVSVYAPGTSTTPVATIGSGINQPAALAFDGNGNLYVANAGNATVTKYAPPFTSSSKPAATIGSSASIAGPAAMAIDGLGNAYVVNTGNQTVVEFAPNGSIVRTITGLSLGGTNLVAVDPLHNAYVPNEGGTQSLNVYAPGASTTPAKTYVQGMSGPMDVVVWP